MRLSVAAALVATTNPSILVAPSAVDPSSLESTTIVERTLGKDGDNSSTNDSNSNNIDIDINTDNNPNVRLSQNSPSKSGLLTNQKTTKDTETDDSGFVTARDSNGNENSGDVGILSPSRRLAPKTADEFEGVVNAGRPSSDVFDSFNVVDRDGMNFYSICDDRPDDSYFCTRCDKDSEEGTVGAFDCQKVKCYEIDSRCPNNQMVVCRYDTLKRTVDGVDANSTELTVPYTTERCRNIETRMTKTNRQLVENEESTWDFSYCLRYSIDSVPVSFEDGYASEDGDTRNRCEMEVDGIVCSSCQLEFAQVIDPSSNDTDTTTEEFCASFDCGNTILGYSGRFCNAPNLASNSIDYFIYRSLPCDDGCNLCGDRTDADPMAMMRMQFPDSSFAPIRNDTGSDTEPLPVYLAPLTTNCFEAQWEALVGPTVESNCGVLKPAVQEMCGCTSLGGSPSTEDSSSSSSEDDGTGSSSSSSSSSDDETNGTVGDDKAAGSGAMPTTTTSATRALLATLAAASSLIGFGLV